MDGVSAKCNNFSKEYFLIMQTRICLIDVLEGLLLLVLIFSYQIRKSGCIYYKLK
jgi:hypothetical protein